MNMPRSELTFNPTSPIQIAHPPSSMARHLFMHTASDDYARVDFHLKRERTRKFILHTSYNHIEVLYIMLVQTSR